MTDSELVELVAEAMFMAGGRYHMDMRWRHATGDHQELFRKNARVAIATLRELGVMT